MVKTLSACCVAGRLRMTPLAHHDAGLPTSSKQCSCFDAAAALLQPQRPLCHTCVPTHQTTRLWQPCTTPDKRVNPCATLPSACLPAAHATCHAQNDSSLYKSDPGMTRKRCRSAGVCAAPHNPARIGFAFFRRLGFSALPSAAERPPSLRAGRQQRRGTALHTCARTRKSGPALAFPAPVRRSCRRAQRSDRGQPTPRKSSQNM